MKSLIADSLPRFDAGMTGGLLGFADCDACTAGSFQGTWDYFTNFGNYMSRLHCVRRADGTPDWPWVIGLIVLTLGVIVSYMRIFLFWRRSYLEVAECDRNKKLMDLAYVFLWCAVCGYGMSVAMFFWPAYRLLAIFLVVLNFFSWRFASSLNDFKVSLAAKALQRRLEDEIRNRNVVLERQVSEQTAALRESESAARKLAWTDRLTGLPNRAALSERLAALLADAATTGERGFAVLFLDFDRFKFVNDSLGHQVGDELLCALGRRLQELLNASAASVKPPVSAAAFRLGGDEFVALLENIPSPAFADTVARRLLAGFEKPHLLGTHEIYASASIGIVTGDLSAGGAEDILRDADTAMYEAKSAGRSRFMHFDESMRRRVQNRMALETDLRKAVDAGQLFLLYQPIVSTETGRLEGFEALVRWRHPTRGVIPPVEFIPIAEETGLIVSIGKWVLAEACRQFKRWTDAARPDGPRAISVNLSRNQLLQPDLPQTVRDILTSTGVEPSALHLEITESTMMANGMQSLSNLNALKAIGVKLEMDDFGTGYSSLACLHQFPIDTLKIDRSFVANIDRGRDFMSLVHAIALLARNLGIAVVAEGIETRDQLQVLQALECQFGQGYYIGRPMTAEQATGFKMDLSATTPAAA